MSAYEEAVHPLSLNAAADYSQPTDESVKAVNRFATVAGQVAGEFARCADNGISVGVLTSKPMKGSPGRIAMGGVAPIELGATLAAGVTVASDSQGRAKAVGANPAAAIILEGGVAGDVVPAIVIVSGK